MFSYASKVSNDKSAEAKEILFQQRIWSHLIATDIILIMNMCQLAASMLGNGESFLNKIADNRQSENK